MANKIKVEVAYAKPNQQCLISVELTRGSTIKDAIIASQILNIFPEIDLAKQKVGIFSKPREISDLIQEGDRIEIYRPLTIDPKEARRAKALKKKNI